MNEFRRFNQFQAEHGLPGDVTAHHYALADGDLWFAETRPGEWAVSFYPYRTDHPDAPALITDSTRETIDGGGGADAVGERLRAHLEGRDPRTLLDVLVEEGASPSDVAALADALDECGIPAAVRPGIARRSVGDMPWIVLITVPAGAIAAGFFGKAGSDAWDGLKRVVGRIYAVRRSSEAQTGSIEISEGNRALIFSETVTDAGYRAIAELPSSGYYVWDPQTSSWRASP
jgi:hypothetical protein